VLYTDFAEHLTFIARAGGGQNQAGRAPEPSLIFSLAKKGGLGFTGRKLAVLIYEKISR
jgi:hypothetical protein